MMEISEFRTEKIPVQLPNGAIVKLEVAQIGREDVAFEIKSFQEVTDALEGIMQAIADSLQKAKPHKASVKFGLEVTVDSGQLMAVIVRGSGKANLEITLEWQQ